ncbi:glycoside hydrolase domain-containing protein [Paenibacillus ferrarius]|uniref:glycoside hydrolase domain-containing protein n=1 Tax=Paenibacillus ferrarius TaxID=1469647 RepID=UPI001301A999|nr:glycoside hydrolase domain-containing protein [Paenibacillus ferrarius]
MNSWIKWKHKMDLYFVWHGTHWRHNHQGPRSRTNQNVFGYPVTFMYVNTNPEDEFYGETGIHWGNGDGILFYPDHDPYYREQDRGVQALLSSIRMKNLRRGIQDYEYIWLAASLGKQEQVDQLVRTALPRVLHETDRTHSITWSPYGNDWDDYRKKISDLIQF